jgi:hypothetical protein
MTCTTHHHACRCREALIKEAMDYAKKLIGNQCWTNEIEEFNAMYHRLYGNQTKREGGER